MNPWRLPVAALWLAACVSAPAVHAALDAAAVVHTWMIERLMAGFVVHSLRVEPVAAHLKLRVELQNHSFVVVQGRTVGPGFRFSAETPARQAVLLSALVGAALLLFVRGPARRAWPSAVLAGLAAAGLLLLLPPIVLAGAIWSLVSPDQATALSVGALAIWGSRSALHGGGFALVGLLAWSLISRHRRRP